MFLCIIALLWVVEFFLSSNLCEILTMIFILSSFTSVFFFTNSSYFDSYNLITEDFVIFKTLFQVHV